MILNICLFTILSFQIVSNVWFFWVLLAISWIPTTLAKSAASPFPNPTFQAFSKFILATFSSDISLTTTLLILLSLVNNPELLNLHARQTHPVYENEKTTRASGWMKTLARGLQVRLNGNLDGIFQSTQYIDDKNRTTEFALKLDKMTCFLHLTPYKSSGRLRSKISQISQRSILPVRLICPPNMTCTTGTCNPYHVSLTTRIRDIPRVTLIEGSLVFHDVYALTRECTICHTRYHPDHEAYSVPDSNRPREVFLNTARYLKIGSSLWVDRVFSNAVLSGMYNFHASASAYAQFWNDSFNNAISSIQLSCRQVWQAFVQESIRTVATTAGTDFEADLNIAIDEVS